MSTVSIPRHQFDFSVREAQRLSDLTGVQSDLDSVIQICLKVIDELETMSLGPGSKVLSLLDERHLLADLLCAGIVRYARTLGTGVREGVPRDWIGELPLELRDANQYFKDLRDKLIAHSVNTLEDNQVFVWVSENPAGSPEVSHIAVSRGRYLPGADDAKLLSTLAQAILDRVKREIESENR